LDWFESTEDGPSPKFDAAKYCAAIYAYRLVNEFSQKPPSTALGGQVRNIGTFLYEAFSGEENVELKRQTDAVCRNRRTLPDNGRLRRFIRKEGKLHVAARLRAVTSTGWFGSTFILPDGAVGVAALDEHFILQTAHVVDHAYNIRGSLIEWQHNIARFAVGNSRLALAISAAFAACLVGPCGAESGGIHFRGRSSVGKTTALSVAGSVWGGGDRGFIRSWRATANGLKATAAAHSDGLLCLDEISQLGGREVGEIAYMLANGQGKARGRVRRHYESGRFGGSYFCPPVRLASPTRSPKTCAAAARLRASKFG
jgi:hypothetical protein